MTSSHTPAGKSYLVSLEIGRFFAAFLVAALHASASIAKFGGRFPFDDFFHGGHAGVEYFFLLSGFLIYSIHRHDFGKSGSVRNFAAKRAIRILPMYWLVAGFYLALAIVAPNAGLQRNPDILVILRNFTLTSSDSDLYVGVAWTLQREAVFYGLFAFGLIFPRIGLKAFWLWQAAIIVANIVHPQFSFGARGDPFLGIYNIGFGAGVLIAAALKFWKPNILEAKLQFACGMGLFLALFLLDWYLGAGSAHDHPALGDITSPLAYLFACWLIISGAVRYEMLKGFTGNRWLRILGDSSYVLYLTHEACISTVARVFRPAMPFKAEMTFLLALATAVVVAVAIHLAVEKPILTGLRRMLPSRTVRLAPA